MNPILVILASYFVGFISVAMFFTLITAVIWIGVLSVVVTVIVYRKRPLQEFDDRMTQERMDKAIENEIRRCRERKEKLS